MAKNKIHSVLTALPVLMLMIGLGFYYKGEKAQTGALPIAAESSEIAAVFTGLSAIQTGSSVGKHYLWFEQEGRKRGARINPAHKSSVEHLQAGEPIRIWLAPTVSGSKTRWVYRLESGSAVLLDSATQ